VKHAYYAERLAPLLELEDRLIKMLGEGNETEVTHLEWPSPPSSSTRRQSLQIDIVSTEMAKLRAARTTEVYVRATSDWEGTFMPNWSAQKISSSSTNRWDDPRDLVHNLDPCRDAMLELCKDEVVLEALKDSHIRLEESSGL
jgi:guanine nucleotide-binding protein alpha-1 subunit